MSKPLINKELIPVWVDFMPDNLEQGKLYISLEYNTVIHLCACGCGEKTVTPLGENWWSIHYTADKQRVTLNPSIGNWKMPCSSHYVIVDNVARFCEDSGKGR